jgi:hypothetical protein
MTGVGVTILALEGAFFVGVVWWMTTRGRQWNRKARVKRRLLVEENGEIVWRTSRARYLVGSPSSKGELSWGLSVPREKHEKDEPWSDEWAVLQGGRGLLVAYRVADHKKVDDHKVGTIQLCRSWEELEAAVPAKVFEEAELAAGRQKPPQYRELPVR